MLGYFELAFQRASPPPKAKPSLFSWLSIFAEYALFFQQNAANSESAGYLGFCSKSIPTEAEEIVGTTRLSISKGVTIEKVGPEALVLLPNATSVLRLKGPSAAILYSIQAGVAPDTSDFNVVDDLIRQGIIVDSSVTRRSVVKAAGLVAGAGATAVLMPGVAAAASSSGEEESGTTSPAPGEIEVVGYWAESGGGYQFTVTFTTGNSDFVSSGFEGDLTFYQNGDSETVVWDSNAYVSDPYVGWETADPAGFILVDGETYYARFAESPKSYFVTFLDEDDWNDLALYS